MGRNIIWLVVAALLAGLLYLIAAITVDQERKDAQRERTWEGPIGISPASTR